MRRTRARVSSVGVLVLTALTGIMLSSCRDHRADVSEALLDAYAGGCSTSGAWTEAALTHNRALVSILQKLRETDACKAVAPSLANLQLLTSELEYLLQDEGYNQTRLSEEKVQELTLSLQDETDPAAIEILQNALVEARLELATLRSETNRTRYLEQTSQLASTIQSLLQQTSTLTDCLAQSPGAALQLANNLMAIGGSFISPVFGAASSAVGQLINFAVEFSAERASSKALWNLYEAKMPHALTCGLESMTRLYCQASDAFELVQLQAQSYGDSSQPLHPIWRGLDLIGRRLPVLKEWLFRVKTGVVPTSSEEAGRQIRVWNRLHQLQSTNLDVLGQLNHRKRLYLAAKDAKTRKSTVSQTVLAISQGLAPSLCDGCTISSPFYDFNSISHRYACWLVKGYLDAEGQEVHCPDYLVGGNSMPLQYYIENVLLTVDDPEIDPLFSNWSQVFAQVKALVDLEFSQTITVDPARLLGLAFHKPANNISAFEVLQMIESYLQAMVEEDDGSNPQNGPLLASSLKMTRDALNTLSDVKSGEALNRVLKLFEIFQLQLAETFYTDRIQDFVDWDLRTRLDQGDFPDNLEEILRSAAMDIRERLLASGVYSLDLVTADLNKARSITQGNLEVFRSFFEKDFARAVDYLEEKRVNYGEPEFGVDRPNGQSLGELCTLLLTTGLPTRDGISWPKKVSWEICARATYYSTYPKMGADLTLKVGELEKKLEGKSHTDQVCTFYRFLRAGRLVEALQQRRRSFGPEQPEATIPARFSPWSTNWMEIFVY